MSYEAYEPASLAVPTTTPSDALIEFNVDKEMNMGEKVVRFSDLSGQMADAATGGLIPLVVTDYPDADPDQRVRIEVTPDELEKIGKLSIAAVGLETEPTGEEQKRSRFVVPIAKLASLATVAPIEEVLANAEPIEPPKNNRRPQGEGRRSHNQRADGGPLINYNEPANAGLPHKGKIGEVEAAFVRDNLALVNERRTAAGHAPIDPSNPEHAKRYVFEDSDTASTRDS
jgi:hypothetical protein